MTERTNIRTIAATLRHEPVPRTADRTRLSPGLGSGEARLDLLAGARAARQQALAVARGSVVVRGGRRAGAGALEQQVARLAGDGRVPVEALARMGEAGGIEAGDALVCVDRDAGRVLVTAGAVRAAVADVVGFLGARGVINARQLAAARRIADDRAAAGLRMRLSATPWASLIGLGVRVNGAGLDADAQAEVVARMAAAQDRLRRLWGRLSRGQRQVVWAVVVEGETLGEAAMRIAQGVMGRRGRERMAGRALTEALDLAAVFYSQGDALDTGDGDVAEKAHFPKP